MLKCILKSSFPCPHRLVWPRTSDFRSDDTGSNPVGDAKIYEVNFDPERVKNSTKRRIFGESKDLPHPFPIPHICDILVIEQVAQLKPLRKGDFLGGL